MLSFFRKHKKLSDEEAANQAEQERLLHDIENLNLSEYWKDVPREQRVHPFTIRKQQYDAWVEERRLERTGGRPPMYQPRGAKGVKTVATEVAETEADEPPEYEIPAKKYQ